MKTTLRLLAACLALAACGPTATRGEVTGKEYDDPDEWTTMDCAMRDSKTYACTLYLPNEHYDGPHYYLNLRDRHPDKPDEWITGRVEVTEADYNRCREGWHYPECTPR